MAVRPAARIVFVLVMASAFLTCCRARGAECREPRSRSAAPPACSFVTEGDGPPGSTPLHVEVVARGLNVPWDLAFLPDGSMLVTERSGLIRRVVGGHVVGEPVVRVSSVARGEGGLLGLALTPDFASTRRFFIYYTADTDAGPVNRVERWRLAEDSSSAVRERVLVDGIPAAQFHDGGRIRIGPDHMLYVGTGDARDPRRAQDRGSLSGKILRVDPTDGSPAPGNPQPRSRIYVLGVRNPEAFDWRQDGSLVVADHGPSGEMGRHGNDEISIARAGANLGWPAIYGCRRHPGMVTPAIAWQDAMPPGGAVFYTGHAIPGWHGDLVVASLGTRDLHRIHFDPDHPDRVLSNEVYLDGRYGRLRAAVMGPDGQLYLTTSNCDGRGTCGPERDLILRVTGAMARASRR